MKANLIIHCANCGETKLIFSRKPDTSFYTASCPNCGTLLATIPTYGLTFNDDDEKEDNHAYPTE